MIELNALLANRYRVEKKLGEGGMGAVYLAVDERFNSHVALKETLVGREREDLRRAFRREAALLNKLKHAALPKVIDFFDYGEAEVLVMEYIPGEDLGEMLRENGGPFPVVRVLEWADKVLDALAFLHTRQPPVIHRDIKPQNMKLTPEGDVVLLDFGLAKGSSGHPSISTTPSVVAGTPAYAPLEQTNHEGTDARSDLYSLAATLYALLTYRLPIDASTRASALVNGMPDPLPPVYAINPAVPKRVSSVIHRAMSLRRASRPESAADMRHALHDAVTATMPGTVRFAPLAPPVDSAGASRSETVPLPPPPPAPPPPVDPMPAEEPGPNDFATPKMWATPLATTGATFADSPPAPGRRRVVFALGGAAVVVAGILLASVFMVSKFTGNSAPDAAPKPDATAVAPKEDAPVAPAATEVLWFRPEKFGGGFLDRPDRLPAAQDLRFRFTAPSTGRLFLVVIDPSGGYQTFLTDKPAPATKVTTNAIRAREDYLFPGPGAPLRFKTGSERLVVVFAASGTPVPACLTVDSMRMLTPSEVKEVNGIVAASRDSVRTAPSDDGGRWIVVTRTGDARTGIVAFEFP